MTAGLLPLVATLVITLIHPPAKAQTTESGRIEGIVTRFGSSQPISGVSVTLKRKATLEQTEEFFDWSAGRRRAPKESLSLAHDGATVVVESVIKSVTTDRTGRFSIEDVPAGSYAVNAWREGYFGRGTDPETSAMYDGAAMFDMVFVSVEPGGIATSTLELIAGGAISGRVMSPQGTPLVDQDVRAFRAYRQGEETLLRGVTLARTDDRGQYRLHTLPPGEYFVASGLGLPEIGDGDPEKVGLKQAPGEQISVLTFHPSTINPESALSIVLTDGQDVVDKDIQVQTARVIRISGSVIDDSGFPDVSRASVQLLPRARKWRIDHGGALGDDVHGDGVLAGTGALFTAPSRGSFEFRGAFAPGSYEVRATVSAQDRRKAAGSALIHVRSEDVEGITIIVND